MKAFLRNLTLSAWLGLFGVVAFCIAWELLSQSGLVNRAMLPSPLVVAHSAWLLLLDGELEMHVYWSMLRAIAGFVSGSALAVVLGITMAQIRFLDETFNPLLQMFRAIPSLAFVPLAIFWLGIGETSKIFLIAWGVFFPVWINIGVRDTNPLLSRAAESLGAKGWRNLVFVVLPAALPLILAGLRISLSVALVVLVAAELAGALYGVGYLIQESQQVYRVDYMFVGLLTLGALGFAADYVFERGIRALFPWYGADRTARFRRRKVDG
jgi:NitT/TauT family transport system permease protein/sulfonate transport system permease protein